MAKLINSLKNLGTKVTGQEVKGKYITQVLDDITAKADIPSKEYVDSLLSGALKRVIVEELPEEDIDTNTIYMVLDEEASQEGNVYNEYMYIGEAWELIGTTATSGGGELETVDLTAVTDATVDDLLNALNWDGSSNIDKDYIINITHYGSTLNIYTNVKVTNRQSTGQGITLEFYELLNANKIDKVTYYQTLSSTNTAQLYSIFYDNPQKKYTLVELPLDTKNYVMYFKYYQNKRSIDKFEIPSQGGVTVLTNYYGALQWSNKQLLPTLPSDASNKTYVLKCVNGALTWVEEQA